MRAFLRHYFLSILGHFSKIKKGTYILNAHYLKDSISSKDEFYDLLKKLEKEVEYINFEDAVDLISTGKTNSGKYVAFSYDDGYEDNYTKIYPVLKDFQVNACIFLNPKFIEIDDNELKGYLGQKHFTTKIRKPLSWAMIREMSNNGFLFGDHTFSHVDLATLDEEYFKLEILESKKKIEDEVDKSCIYFAWPYGKLTNVSDNVLTFLLEHYNYVFSSDNNRKYYSFNNHRVINRRHFEGDWPLSHVKYFLSFKKDLVVKE